MFLSMGSTGPSVLKLSLLWSEKFSTLLKHIYLWVLSVVLWHLQLWQLVFPWYPICRWVTRSEFLHQLDIIFPPISLLQIGIRNMSSVLYWASLSRCFVGKCQTLTYIKSCDILGCETIALPSAEYIVPKLCVQY